MRVFLDTNVIVSAFATRGLSADVVRFVLAEHDLCTSEEVLEETRRVLQDTFGIPEPRVREIESLLRESHVEPTPEAAPPVEVRDPDDEPILAAALASGAAVLVTGDGDLLDVADSVEGLRIVTPRAFWDDVRSSAS